VEAWRRDLLAGREGRSGGVLCRLVWLPVAGLLPAGTSAVYLCPDGALARIPWAALPGGKPGAFLLEDYALAVVPHGPFLLDQLTAPSRPTGCPWPSPTTCGTGAGRGGHRGWLGSGSGRFSGSGTVARPARPVGGRHRYSTRSPPTTAAGTEEFFPLCRPDRQQRPPVRWMFVMDDRPAGRLPRPTPP